MIHLLTPHQHDFFTVNVQKALVHAAQAFADFISKKVVVTDMSLGGNIHTINTSLSEDKPIFSLISVLKGDLRGKCYLNLSSQDADVLTSIALPEVYRQNKEMKEGILLELDNILTAAVVSILSNAFKLDTFAYVPKMYIFKSDELNQWLWEDYKEEKLALHFSTGFKIESHDIHPEFIWVLDENIIKFIESAHQTLQKSLP